MDTANIIAQIDREIARLHQAKLILEGTISTPRLGRPKGSGQASQSTTAKPVKHVMTAEGKAKIAAAQKARWARIRKAAKKTT